VATTLVGPACVTTLLGHSKLSNHTTTLS
jgi:hypothetical protein